jgi:mannosyltransferase
MEQEINVYLDTIVFRIQKYGGASTYWKELLIDFLRLKNVYLIVQSNDLSELNSDGKVVVNLYDHRKLFLENILPASFLRYLPFTKILPAKSIYHASYYRTSFQKNIVNIFTVHDFTHKKGYASKYPRKMVHIGLTFLGIKNADGIICISQNTKNDLIYYYPQIPEDRVKVIYHGVSKSFYPFAQHPNKIFRSKFNLKESFALFVGKREGYKNFAIVPEAIKKIENLKLVIVGGGELSKAENEHLDRILPGRYYKLDDVSNEELNELYNYAYCLIYTSIYEGFGIPLLEAMKAGCPVITNRLSSLHEVAGDAALMINDNTSGQIAERLNELCDESFRNVLIDSGFVQSAKFTWEKCAQETSLFYQEIYDRKFSEK